MGATLQSSTADPNPKADTLEKSLPGPAEDLGQFVLTVPAG
jgi:hypothetical protein